MACIYGSYNMAYQEGLRDGDVPADRRPQQRCLRRGVPGLQHAGFRELLPRVFVPAGVGSKAAGGRGRLPQEEEDKLGVLAQAGVVEGGVALLWCQVVCLCSEIRARGYRGVFQRAHAGRQGKQQKTQERKGGRA